MDLHQLQAFDHIVVYNSFSKAARKLGVSQPTSVCGFALLNKRWVEHSLSEEAVVSF